MVAIPKSEPKLIKLIDTTHEQAQEPPRPHMGCSQIGHKCERYLWLSFRWAAVEYFPGRILRLFRRGQNEEDTVIADLRAAGLEIDGRQDRVDFGSHVSGSTDGVIDGGVPEAPKSKHVLEIKTHSRKSFNDLEKDGLEKSKPMHYTQMQVYMRGLSIDRALYAAVCKDDDRYYFERVKLDKEFADKAIERAKRIALSDRMPPPMLGASATWYECKFCSAYSFCHEGEKVYEVNCRTCEHSEPTENSTWHCHRWNAEIPVEAQRVGCDDFVLHGDIHHA